MRIAMMTVLSLIALMVTPISAQAAVPEDELWYFHDFNIASIHERGITGAGVTVAVIDSPINLEAPDLRDADIRPRTESLCPGYTGVESTERARHATAMTSYIVGNGAGLGDVPGVLGIAPEATVLHYAVLEVPVADCPAPLDDFVADAIEQGAQVLNLSISYDSPRDATAAVTRALRAGLIVNVAVQNANSEALDLLSGMNGVVSIENVDRAGMPDAYSVRGPGLDLVAPGVDMRMIRPDFSSYGLGGGTSAATAWATGVFALGLAAWPEASGNQLLQSAIRNTENRMRGWSELERSDTEGFGLLSPRALIEVDPGQYADANPLLVDGVQPSYEAVTGDTGGAPDWGISTVVRGFGDSVVQQDPETETRQLVPPQFLWLITGLLLATACRIVILLIRRARFLKQQRAA